MGNIFSRLLPIKVLTSTLLRLRVTQDGDVHLYEIHLPMPATVSLPALELHLRSLEVIPVNHSIIPESVQLRSSKDESSENDVIRGLENLWHEDTRGTLSFSIEKDSAIEVENEEINRPGDRIHDVASLNLFIDQATRQLEEQFPEQLPPPPREGKAPSRVSEEGPAIQQQQTLDHPTPNNAPLQSPESSLAHGLSEDKHKHSPEAKREALQRVIQLRLLKSMALDRRHFIPSNISTPSDQVTRSLVTHPRGTQSVTSASTADDEFSSDNIIGRRNVYAGIEGIEDVKVGHSKNDNEGEDGEDPVEHEEL